MEGGDDNSSLRGWFALAALLVFVLTLGWGFCLTGTKRWANAKEILTLAVPIEAGLLLAAGRYYFTRPRPRTKHRTETRRG